MVITGRAFSGFGLLVSLVGLGAQSPGTSLKIEAPAECLNIRLYNLAEVSSRTLDRATEDAGRVLATAGVDRVCWVVLADAPEAHTLHTSPPPTWRKNRRADSRGYLVAVIVRSIPVDYFPGALGYALPDAEIGVNAMIFYERIERFQESGEVDLPTLLGHAMAHEIGHVLLGTTEHSPGGIMKARWSRADFQFTGLRLRFTAFQRAEVLRHRTLIAPHQRSNRERTSSLRLTLVIYDHAQVAPGTLAAAENTVSGIFGHANVQLIWRNGFAYAGERRVALNPAPEDPATLVIKLQPESEAVRYGVGSVCGGIGFPSGAIVFVRSFDSTRLGYVMAHELGHMLLGPNAHSLVGIMRGTLLPESWGKAEQGALVFTHSQNQQIRIWIEQQNRR